MEGLNYATLAMQGYSGAGDLSVGLLLLLWHACERLTSAWLCYWWQCVHQEEKWCKKKKKVHVSIIICLQWWKFLTAAIVVCCIYCLTSLTSGCFSVWWPVVLTVWEGSWGNASRVFCDMKNARSPFVFSYAGKKCLLCSCSLFGACCSTTSSLIPDFFLEIKLKINSQKTFWCS